MNVSGSRSELILDLLSLDGWLPTQNATTLGSTRVKELTGVVENGRTFRNVTIQPENSAPIVKSPRKQGHAKSETISTVAVKGMVLSVHDTYSTIKRMPARMEITASKDKTDNQSLDHLVNHSLRRIEEVLPTSNDLAQFFRQTMWPQSIETKPPPQTPIQFINVEPVSKTPLESTLNVTLAPWHFERLRSPEKMAVFHSSMQPKNSKVSIFGQQIIENVNSVVQNLQNGLDGDASLPDFPLNILSTKLCNEANEISILSRLKSTLDSTMDSTRSVATIAALAATLGDAKKKLGKAKGSKSKKKSADTKTNSGNADKKEKNKTKKKSNKAVKQLTDTGEYSDSTGNKAQEIDEISSCDSEDEMDPKGTSLKGVRGKKGGRDSDKDSNAEGNTDGASDGFGEGLGEGNQKTSVNLSEQQKKISYKKIAAKSVAKVDDGSFNIEAGMVSKSLTDSELVAKLKLTLTSAQKFAGNAAQLINAHEVLACADHYLGELKSRISGLGIVGYAERHMLVAFRQGSYKLMSSKGKLCMIMRMFPEAVDSYTRAFEFCDWMPEILFLRAQAHMKKGDITSAQKDLEAAKSIVRDGFVDKSQNPSQFQFQSNSYNAFVESLSDAIASAQSVITSFDDDEAHHENKKALKSQGQVQPKLAHVPVAISDGSGNNEQWPRNRVFMLAAEYDSMIHHGLSEEVIYKCDILLAEDNSNGLVWALRGRALLVLGRVEEGLKNINRSVACWGECYECRLYRALAYRQSDPSAAELDLDLCTQMSCCGAIVYILRASLKESTHRNSEAALDWELASRKDSSRRNEYRFRACKLLFEDNRRSDCLHMLERLRASSPHYIPTYLLLADLQVRMGNHKGAVAGLSRALMMEPWNPLLFFKRAQVLLMKDRSEDSMRDLVMFFRLNGAVNHGIKNDDGNSVKAASRFEVSMIELHCKALISLQYWKDVILLLQQNEKLVAESCSLQTLLGHIFFHVGQYGKAELYLRRAIDMSTLDAAKGTATLSLILLGWSMCMQGSWMEGESALSVAHSLDSSCLDAIFGLGCCSMNYGNFEAAAARFTAGLALESQHPGCLEGRAIARYRSGRLQEAVSDLTLALRLCQSQSSEAKAKSGRAKSFLIVPDLTYARWKRTKGLFHVLLGNYSVAEQDMASSLEFEPNSSQAHTWKAFLCMKRGLWSKSVDMLKMTLKIVSNDLNALALLCICYFKLNDWALVIRFTELYAREARIKLNQKAFDFKQIQQDQHGCSAEGIDGGSVISTIGDLNDLIEQVKVAHDSENHSQLQKRIATLTEMFLGDIVSETKSDDAEVVPGIRFHDVMNHNHQIPPMTLCGKVELMNDRWKRVSDTKIVAFLPDNLAMMHLEALGHMKMNKEALHFVDQFAQMRNSAREPIHNGMLLLMARVQIDKARSSDPAKCGAAILSARKYLLVLLHQDPYNIAAHLCMAYLWCHENLLDRAEYHIMAVLHMDPKCTDALQLRAQFNASLGNLYAAESDISQACRINPEDANLFITYASIKKLIPYSDNQVSVNLSEALGYRLSEADIIASALEIDPNQRNVLIYIAITLLEDSRFQDAVDILSKCISLYPYDAAAYINRGIAFSCLHKFTEAREDFQASMRLNPYSSDVLLNFAFLEDTCQKSGLAQRLLEKAADVSPLDADVHEVRANFYAKTGRARKGRLAAQTAHWLRSDSLDQAKTMGLRFWNFVLDRENGSATCDNMGIYGINIISMTLVAKARPLSMRQENDKKSEKDKSRDKAKVALTFSSAENTSAQEEGLKAPGAKAAGGTIGKSPRAKFIQSVPMHDGIGRNYSNNPKATAVVPKPPKKKAAGEK